MTWRLVITITLLFGPGMLESREIQHRIVLKRGGETTVSGRIPTPQDISVYFLQLRAGEHLSAQLNPGPTLRAWALLKPPSGDQIGPGTRIDSVVDKTGMFEIRIIPLEQSSGDFRLHVSLQ
ncbi:MAG: hypothetical protein WBY44_21060 [Bryobacteraceae bacterium]